MYGFLRANKNHLEQSELDFYKKMYCGQCYTMQVLFGYKYRLLISYDALFISLLYSSQNSNSEIEEKRWCAIFPKRVKVISPNEKAQILSACISMSLFSLKLSDSLQEKKTNIKSFINKISQSKILKANNILSSLGFPKKILNEVLEKQEKAEKSLDQNITKYAEPSAYFCGEVFQFTASLNGKQNNKDTLFKIGYNVGLVIYLVDSCIDILDDIKLKSFNALLASYKDEITIVNKNSSTDVSTIVLNAMNKIKKLTKQLVFCKHENIIKNILCEGFPTIIINKIINSINRLNKEKPTLINFLPHIAIMTGLCLIPDDVHAKWVWGKELDNYGISGYYNVYGFTCCTGCCDGCPLCLYLDCLLNPCVYFDLPNNAPLCNCCVQIPKASISGFGIVKGINAIYKKNEINLRNKEANRKILLNIDFNEIIYELKTIQKEINSYSQKLKLKFKQDFTDEIHSYFNSSFAGDGPA